MILRRRSERGPLFLVLALVVSGLASADLAHSPRLPDPQLTPGDVLTTDPSTGKPEVK
jgi:hypothetical protein